MMLLPKYVSLLELVQSVPVGARQRAELSIFEKSNCMKRVMKRNMSNQQRHAMQVFRAVTHDFPLFGREYTREAGNGIDGYFFSSLELMPIVLEPCCDAHWVSALGFGFSKGQRNAVIAWPLKTRNIAESELKKSLDGVGTSETDRFVVGDWDMLLERDLTHDERRLLATPPDEQRYKFYFSRQQQIEQTREKRNRRSQRPDKTLQYLALLDTGKVAEFTEPIFLEP
jgi:hypothetical protein